MKEVRVVICGDQGVGKSSLISALIQEDNVTSIPKVACSHSIIYCSNALGISDYIHTL